jgi:hypothetical protein
VYDLKTYEVMNPEKVNALKASFYQRTKWRE